MRREPATIGVAAVALGAFAIGAGAFADVGVAVRVLILAAGLLLLLFGIWALIVARRPHPHIRRHSVVRLPIAEVAARARAGEPFVLPLGKSRVEVLVRPQPVTTEEATIVGGRAGEVVSRAVDERILEEVVTFAGEVQGARMSEVRLTITDAWLRGYVLTEDDWWFLEPLRKFRLEAAFNEYIVYRTRDLRFRLEFGEDYKPRRVEGGAGGGGPEPSHRVNPIVPVAMVHDEQYNWQAGGRAYDYQRALINEVNGIYSQVGCEFRISVFIWTVNWLTSTSADRMLDQVEDVVKAVWTDLRQVANRRARNTEAAHATTGKNLDGNTLGIAWQPGVYGLSQQQLIWIGGGGLFGGPPNLAFQNMMVAAHELGHNFNGAHEEADEWCVSHFIWCWDNVRTLMWPTYYDDNVSRFSDGTRNSSHNNAQRVSTNMASGRNVNF
jgi:Metallo-peptidase family M12